MPSKSDFAKRTKNLALQVSNFIHERVREYKHDLTTKTEDQAFVEDVTVMIVALELVLLSQKLTAKDQNIDYHGAYHQNQKGDQHAG